MKERMEDQLKRYFENTKASTSADFSDKVMRRVKQKKMRESFLFPKLAYASFLLVIFLTILLVYNVRKPDVVMVTFQLRAPEARSVYLAGDFNNWQPNEIKLKQRNGEWYIELPLKPGRYQYNFLINGKEWVPDPNADFYVDDGFGQKNSVIDLTEI